MAATSSPSVSKKSAVTAVRDLEDQDFDPNLRIIRDQMNAHFSESYLKKKHIRRFDQFIEDATHFEAKYLEYLLNDADWAYKKGLVQEFKVESGIQETVITILLTEKGNALADLLYGKDRFPPFDYTDGLNRKKFAEGYSC